jgi:uncharacterized protein YdaU (DUF1376 family)
MRQLRYIALFACLALPSLCFAQKEDWLPITSQDQQIKEVPGNAGASAIQLYYADYIDDVAHSEFFYRRIKVLTEAGKEHGNVEITVLPSMSVGDLKARTIHPDGKIIEFAGKPFDKTIFKAKGVKIQAKTFTMPEVTVGSIIEYKYKLRLDNIVITENSWTVQHNLFTLKENFYFKAYQGGFEDSPNGSQVSYVLAHLDQKPKQKGSTVELSMENVAAFESEGYMPPEDNYKQKVLFFYTATEATTVDKFWQDGGKRWNNRAERLLGNYKEVKETATEAIGGETDPEKKLRKLYARAQQIRNLTYERERTEAELKRENIKGNENVGDVLKRGYGDREDVTFLFVALARAAGFDASVVMVSSREERFFNRSVLSKSQLDSQVAAVQFNGKDLFLDPGTKFCPFGLIRWTRTSTAALKLDKNGGTFVTVTPAAQDKAVIARTANLTLSEDGSLEGEVAVEFKGGEALERRLSAYQTDEAGRKKDMEDEFKNWLVSGANVQMTGAKGWDAPDESLVIQFSVEIPGYSSAAGKRLLTPAYLFQAKQKDAFKHAQRKYPIYFPYAFAELDKVSIKLPAGYSLESVPPLQQADLPYARYENLSQLAGTLLVTQRSLRLNGIYFDVSKYAELKEFFSKVQAGDEEQAVFRVGGSVNAQKSN